MSMDREQETYAAERAELEACVALDWEPWDGDASEYVPHAKDWDETLITMRIAWRTVSLPKAEVITAMRQLGPDLTAKLLRNLAEAQKDMERLRRIAEVAEARMIAAGAVLQLEDLDAAGL